LYQPCPKGNKDKLKSLFLAWPLNVWHDWRFRRDAVAVLLLWR